MPTLTRTSSYCGLKSKASFATSDVFVMCFEQCNNLTDWELCMERKVFKDKELGGRRGDKGKLKANFRAKVIYNNVCLLWCLPATITIFYHLVCCTQIFKML